MTDHITLGGSPTEADLRRWITAHVAGQTRRPPADIGPDVPLTDLGLDSVYAAGLAADLEDALGLELDPSVALAHDSVGALAGFLAEELTKGARRA